MLSLIASALVAILKLTLGTCALLGAALVILALCIAVVEAAGYRYPTQTERNGLFD